MKHPNYALKFQNKEWVLSTETTLEVGDLVRSIDKELVVKKVIQEVVRDGEDLFYIFEVEEETKN